MIRFTATDGSIDKNVENHAGLVPPVGADFSYFSDDWPTEPRLMYTVKSVDYSYRLGYMNALITLEPVDKIAGDR